MSRDLRILLVDDERIILETYSMLLKNLGYQVYTASHPNDAIKLISADEFDIVFLDQFLGPVRGLDLIPQMSEVNPELYYIIITANGSTDLAVESLKSGASDFITKPFQIADLVKSIEYVRKKRDLDRERKEMLSFLELKVDEKTEELKSIYFSVLSSLAQAMEKRDIGTYGHCRRVSHYSAMIACAMGLNEREKADLDAAGMLHDIGKIGISDFILGKKGTLNGAEVQTVKSHPQKGVEILKPLPQFKGILPAILHHHENYDGSGYPCGLSGEDIPLHARIISVADTYDAILSDRPYRTGAGHHEAIGELVRCSGRQFDPYIIAIVAESGVLTNAKGVNPRSLKIGMREQSR